MKKLILVFFLLIAASPAFAGWSTMATAALAIGSAVSGGTAGRVLFEAAGPVLSDSANFTFNGTGVTSGFFSTTTASPAASGLVRAANGAVGIAWRNAAGNNDNTITGNGSDQFVFANAGTSLLTVGGGPLVQAGSGGGFSTSGAGGYRAGATGSFFWDTISGGLFATASFTYRFGSANSATPNANALQIGESARNTIDNNVVGGSGTIQPGVGTGNVTASLMKIDGPAVVTIGGNASQAVIDRHIFGYTKVGMSNNTPTTIANITVGTDSSASVILDYACEVNDGASHHQQTEVGECFCNVVSTNTVVESSGCTKGTTRQAISVTGGGTLTVTCGLTAANPALLQITSNSGTITPSMIRCTGEVENLTQQAIAMQ